jgi:GST-like protein
VIDFYYWPTPNGWKVAIMLEECGLEYRMIPVNIGRGDQFRPDFLAISPNNRMPAIVDHDGEDGPVAVFESGAILIHLAERTRRFMPQNRRGRKECLEWLFWQVGTLGPMAGQLSHFVNYAPGEHPYSHKRYADEYNRCLEVLERRLADREFILDDYSIADMASWPWVLIAKPLGQPLDEFPNVARWRETIKQRAPVQRGGRSGEGPAPLGTADRRRATGPVQSNRAGCAAATVRLSAEAAFWGNAACRPRGSPMAARCRRRSPSPALPSSCRRASLP